MDHKGMNKGKGSGTRRRLGRMLVSYGIVFFIGLWLGYKFASTGKTVAPERKEMSESAAKVGRGEQGNGEGPEGNNRASETSSLEREVIQKDNLSLTFYETLLKKESSPEMQGERGDSNGTPAAPVREKRESPSKEDRLSRKALPEGASFSIQVGSFAHEKQAEVLIQRLKEKGYPAYIRSQIISGMGRMYQVRIGRYRTLNDARREAKIIRRKEKLPTYIPSSPDR